MKKIILMLGLLLGAGISNIYAGENEISPVVLESFKNEFSNAENVSWLEGDGVYRAAFIFNSQNMFAYFSKNGELLSMARYISALQLPIGLFSALKNEHSEFWITDLFEVSNNKGTHYYVTLENAENIQMLSSSNGSEWKTMSKKHKL